MERINPLEPKQIKILKEFKLSQEHKPFRLLTNGQAINISTGILSSKGSNIIHHPVYWDRSKEFARLAKKHLETNNPEIRIRISYH
jgi:hypothetical protein